MKDLAPKIAVLLLSAFFIQAVLLSSVCISTRGFSGCKEKILVSVDVCTHGGHTAVMSDSDLVAVIPYLPQICMIESTGFPPMPGETVASAEPGETGKPPEPAWS